MRRMGWGQSALLAAAALAATAGRSPAQTTPPATFVQALHAVMARPEFAHASFGVEILSLDSGKSVFALNGQQLFTPGSTTKLLTEGAALKLLGPDYRFHTRVYRAGDLDAAGVLHGDIVLVASGDPNLSNRAQPDGSLAFADEDHSYGGVESRLVPGDPLVATRDLARQIAAAGVRRVTGRVLIDVSLFPEGERELGTGVVISPIMVNDNVIDLTVSPGAAPGAPARLTVSPTLPSIRFDNQIATIEGDAVKPQPPRVIDTPGGGQTVVLAGAIGAASGPAIFGYPVPSPSRFAAEALSVALADAGVRLDGRAAPGESATADPAVEARWYRADAQLAEHVSAPLSEEIKVTLKVSQNLHASATPFILGAVVGKARSNVDAKGFSLEAQMLTRAGLDLSGASQADGAGGAVAAFYSPDFMVRYLAFMAGQPEFPVFLRALPVLGRDGTLARIQTASPGAGHVFAKTGTFGAVDLLTGREMLTGKGLAGYTTTPSGQRYAFALYINRVELKDDRPVSELAGQALGEIASAIYALPLGGGESE